MAQHPAFPHESTGDQFYSESQFETYRILGRHVVEAVFAQSVSDMEDEHPATGKPGDHQARCRALFSSIVRRWFAMPSGISAPRSAA